MPTAALVRPIEERDGYTTMLRFAEHYLSKTTITNDIPDIHLLTNTITAPTDNDYHLWSTGIQILFVAIICDVAQLAIVYELPVLWRCWQAVTRTRFAH